MLILIFLFLCMILLAAILIVAQRAQAKRLAWKVLDKPEATKKELKKALKRLSHVPGPEAQALSGQIMNRLRELNVKNEA